VRILLDRASSRAMDADAIERLGVSGLQLMENAGRGAAEGILDSLPDALGQVVLVGGPGNNGGDAWVVARHLWLRGIRLRAILLGSIEALSSDSASNFSALRALGIEVECAQGEGILGALDAALEGATLIVDGLFGTGLDRPIEGPLALAIRAMNEAPAPIVALDLPSGIDADTGAILGAATEATLTVTFGAAKRGLYQHPGAARAGQIRVASIGVPPPRSAPMRLLESADLATWLPPRAAHFHKGLAGHIVVIGGSVGKTGAALLAGLGALGAGAGLVTLAARDEARRVLESKVIELMTAELSAGSALGQARALLEGKRAAVLGPGLGLDPEGRALCLALAEEAELPLVLDADALSALANAGEGGLGRLRAAPCARVLTPHPGEAARLLGRSVSEVQGDRHAAAQALAERAGQPVVLKGAGTIVACPEGRALVCGHSLPAMGAAGMGDVLAGILGALLGGGADAFEAAGAAVELHALAAQLASQSDRGLLASELARAIPAALERARIAAALPRPGAPIPEDRAPLGGLR